ncbi:AAA family ATPase [Solihabitans fulvus]|uniref:AAA family ATPase n=1 Tax=Solihabitans fulvus TaxID=1892852 RepID=UPI001CB76661|nr:AAA family ATPase [Solihabitans fulvus]
MVEAERRLGRSFPTSYQDREVLNRINAAITLARPLLVTGKPGSGKSSLAYSIARELGLGRVLRWPITSRTTLKAGLYDYDVFGRAQAIGMRENSEIGNFVHLGPLGTALLPHRRPRVLLIDEMDKSDIDLPNDLLNIFEDGEFPVPELIRVRDRESRVTVHTADPGAVAPVEAGVVRCHAFPIVVVTSNGERDFPPAFLRRCLSLAIPDPGVERLAEMVAAHFSDDGGEVTAELVRLFADRRAKLGGMAADQLLNAVHLVRSGAGDGVEAANWSELLDAVWHRLSVGS